MKIEIESAYIKQMSKDTGAEPLKVIEEAIILYKWSIQQKMEGRNLMTIDNKGEKPQIVKLPILDTVKSK